jgi:ankyrin repeat protein
MIRQGMVLLVLLFSMGVSASEDQQAELNATLEGRLLLAVAYGDRGQVESLLELGADPNQMLPGKVTPLKASIRAGHIAIANLLLDKGAHADDAANYTDAHSSLVEAMDGDHVDLAIRLVKEGRISTCRAGGWLVTHRLRIPCTGISPSMIIESCSI